MTSRVLGNSLRFASDKQSASRCMSGKSIACCILYSTSTFGRLRIKVRSTDTDLG
ncbi:hypothetical protein BDQ94DRAFT_155319, partial [Aspergillus welwitschiae]